jgi:hypothetical protein
MTPSVAYFISHAGSGRFPNEWKRSAAIRAAGCKPADERPDSPHYREPLQGRTGVSIRGLTTLRPSAFFLTPGHLFRYAAPRQGRPDSPGAAVGNVANWGWRYKHVSFSVELGGGAPRAEFRLTCGIAAEAPSPCKGEGQGGVECGTATLGCGGSERKRVLP